LFHELTIIIAKVRHPFQRNIINSQQLNEDTYQQSFFTRVEAPVEDSPDSDESCDSPQDQLSHVAREPKYTGRHQMVVLLIKGLQKRLSERGEKLSTSEFLVELPSDIPLTELGNVLKSKGKPEVR
jgi:hypothetical protein